MSDYIPRDILIDILARLPVRSLLRFTCVCRSWYSLITYPNFISTHLNLSLTNPNPNPNFTSTHLDRSLTNTPSSDLLFVRHYSMFEGAGRYALHFDDETFDEYVEFECAFRTANEYFRIVGCCNGLVCLSDDYNTHSDSVIIWNPSIRKSVTLPKPDFNYVPHSVCYLGFGFDHVGNDYKVVRIVYLPDNLNYKVPPNVEVYSLATGTWRSICDVAPRYVIGKFYSMSSFLNGAVHWIASGNRDEDDRGNFISAFDMCSESFKEILMPHSLSTAREMNLCVSVLGTSIAVVQYEKFFQSDYCWIWVMKEYDVMDSWTRILKIDMRDGIRQVMGFRKNGEVLVSARVKGLISYDPKTQEFNYLGIHGSNRSFYACAFTESLVLLKGETRLVRAAKL